MATEQNSHNASTLSASNSEDLSSSSGNAHRGSEFGSGFFQSMASSSFCESTATDMSISGSSTVDGHSATATVITVPTTLSVSDFANDHLLANIPDGHLWGLPLAGDRGNLFPFLGAGADGANLDLMGDDTAENPTHLSQMGAWAEDILGPLFTLMDTLPDGDSVADPWILQDEPDQAVALAAATDPADEFLVLDTWLNNNENKSFDKTHIGGAGPSRHREL